MGKDQGLVNLYAAVRMMHTGGSTMLSGQTGFCSIWMEIIPAGSTPSLKRTTSICGKLKRTRYMWILSIHLDPCFIGMNPTGTTARHTQGRTGVLWVKTRFSGSSSST